VTRVTVRFDKPRGLRRSSARDAWPAWRGQNPRVGKEQAFNRFRTRPPNMALNWAARDGAILGSTAHFAQADPNFRKPGTPIKSSKPSQAPPNKSK